jgi:hypothetical protein
MGEASFVDFSAELAEPDESVVLFDRFTAGKTGSSSYTGPETLFDIPVREAGVAVFPPNSCFVFPETSPLFFLPFFAVGSSTAVFDNLLVSGRSAKATFRLLLAPAVGRGDPPTWSKLLDAGCVDRTEGEPCG